MISGVHAFLYNRRAWWPSVFFIESASGYGHNGYLEHSRALLTHHGVGFAFAALYLYVTSQLGVSPRYAVPAVAFGLATSVFPWLLMFPAMGFGLFWARGPIGTQLFLQQTSIVSHRQLYSHLRFLRLRGAPS